MNEVLGLQQFRNAEGLFFFLPFSGSKCLVQICMPFQYQIHFSVEPRGDCQPDQGDRRPDQGHLRAPERGGPHRVHRRHHLRPGLKQ